MRRVRHASWILCLLPTLPVTLGACAEDDADPGVASDGDGDTNDPVGDQVQWKPARGISITEIEANQGTRVAITDANAAWIDATQRNMRLVSERDTLLRIHWSVADGWQPHEVMARMTLDTGGAAPTVREQTLLISGDSARTSLDRTFFFGLVADVGETSPGTRVQIELFEPDLGDADGSAQDGDPSSEVEQPLPEAARVAPADGLQLIGFEADPMEIKVLMVPIHYTGDGMDTMPNLDEDNVEQLVDSLYERNPVQKVTHQVRGQIGYDKPLTDLADLLPLMAFTKQNDGAGPNVYYHAFIDVGCPVVGCGNFGVAGIAVVAADGQAASLSRVGASVFWAGKSGNIGITVDTFVHELGHNQGLAHVECPGVQAAGLDPNYPYPNGEIGQWGFGIRSYSLHNPTASHDYMTYCGNTWGSDWTFLKTYNRIRSLTSWDGANQAPDPNAHQQLGESLVIGALYPSGAEQWFSLPGSIDVEEIVPGEGVVFERDGVAIEQPAVIQTLSDGETQWVVAPLPEAMTITEVDQVTHVRAGQIRRVVPREEIVIDVVAGTMITR